MAWVATNNFRAVDRLLERPAEPAVKIMGYIPKAQARQLLRYEASEMNRYYFEHWEWVQIPIGVLVLGLAAFTGTGRLCTALAGLMLLTVILQRFLFTPEIIGLGRLLDFEMAQDFTLYRKRFWSFHNMYSAVEVAKWVMGLVLTGVLLYRRSTGKRRHVREQLDSIDNADHSEVNR